MKPGKLYHIQTDLVFEVRNTSLESLPRYSYILFLCDVPDGYKVLFEDRVGILHKMYMIYNIAVEEIFKEVIDEEGKTL